MKRFLIVLAAVAMLAAVAVPVRAQEMLPPDPSRSGELLSNEYMGEKILVDVYILRPVGFLASILGLVGSIGAYPMAALSCSTDLVTQELVEKPLDWTFCRPVGDIDF